MEKLFLIYIGMCAVSFLWRVHVDNRLMRAHDDHETIKEELKYWVTHSRKLEECFTLKKEPHASGLGDGGKE